MKQNTTKIVIRLPTEMRINFRTLCSALNRTQQDILINLITGFIQDNVDIIPKIK